jgi:hypothetical protein
MLGYPAAALADTEHALKDAREIGHAASLSGQIASPADDPEESLIRFPRQRLAREAIMAGGNRVIDAMGPNPSAIRWSGHFYTFASGSTGTTNK